MAHLARELPPPRAGDWLHEHDEAGQTFEQYLRADPVRRGPSRNRIYLCLLGDFSHHQVRVLDATREYLEVFYDTPVEVRKRVPLRDVPASAQRRHPECGNHQLLTTWVLGDLLKPQRPDDALAYLAFTATDLWPGDGWNFVYGQASLHERTGVWSMARNGDPSRPRQRPQCLRRTLGTASHETGHILTMQHCTVHECSMNGSNNQEEADRKPLHLCPTCLRKVCWNLRVEPAEYLSRLETFCRKRGLAEEAAWYRRASAALAE